MGFWEYLVSTFQVNLIATTRVYFCNQANTYAELFQYTAEKSKCLKAANHSDFAFVELREIQGNHRLMSVPISCGLKLGA